MYKYYPMILGIIDTLNDWNDKLNAFASKNMDSVFVGTCIIGVILIVAYWGIGALNKK